MAANLLHTKLSHSGFRTVTTATGRSVHRRPATAPLVLLAGAARARVVPPDVGSIAPWFTAAGTGLDLPMPPEIPISCHEPSRHVHNDFFALLCADRLRAHLPGFF